MGGEGMGRLWGFIERGRDGRGLEKKEGASVRNRLH